MQGRSRAAPGLSREIASVVRRRIAAAQAGGTGPGPPAYLRGCPLAAVRRLPMPGVLRGGAKRDAEAFLANMAGTSFVG